MAFARSFTFILMICLGILKPAPAKPQAFANPTDMFVGSIVLASCAGGLIYLADQLVHRKGYHRLKRIRSTNPNFFKNVQRRQPPESR